MNRIVAEHRQRNQQNRDAWERFTAHRQRVTDILCDACFGRAGRLCVLGAGNCNDLDLHRLTAAFFEVHLVDLDSTALHDGISQQHLSGDPRIIVHAGVDVTGTYETLAEWSPESAPDPEYLQQWMAQVRRPPLLAIPGHYQVVASACLLTQLIDSVVMAIGERHPIFIECVNAIRSQHLRLLLDLAEPGGKIIVFTDFVSSLTAPSLLHCREEELTSAAAQWIHERNFFTGVNPYVLLGRLREEPHVSRVSETQMLPPWRWDFGPRVYAVTALIAERAVK